MKPNLYSKFAKRFSNTRSNPWDGWNQIDIPKNSNLKILDLGCGNGRFLEYLISKTDDLKINSIEYTGIDSSKELLGIFRSKGLSDHEIVRSINLLIHDLESDNWSEELGSSFDLIVGFGLMHHISGFNKRKILLQKAYKYLESDGVMVFTYWQFASNADFIRKAGVKKQNFSSDEYSDSDYLLSFGDDDASRLCHHFTDSEVDELYNTAEININKKFRADGKNKKMNLYITSIK